MSRRILSACLVLLMLFAPVRAASKPFVAVAKDAGFALPPIIVQHDVQQKTGFDWADALREYPLSPTPRGIIRDTGLFLQEGIRKMTGKEPVIRSGSDLTHGIVLTTLAGAPADVRNDPAVQKALRNDGADAYNDREAFFIRSEPARLLLVANTVHGLAAAVVELLESVGYEVLGMGPNWVHVPRYPDRLVFDLERSGRPSFYIRALVPTNAQQIGIGTITLGTLTNAVGEKLPDPADEPVNLSYQRWRIGSRMLGQSMPAYPGHAMQAYHPALVEHMKRTGKTEGFLTPAVHLGPDAGRPKAGETNRRQLWINTDAKGQPGAGKVFLSDGKAWTECNPYDLGVSLDVSVPEVRQMILADMKRQAQAHFASSPEDVFVFGTEPEDGGGYAELAKDAHHPRWYPDYLKAEGLPFGRPYVLHGHFGIDQPHELWDPTLASNFVFGFDNWLLHEFDRWIDSLPARERVTPTGKSKKALVRCSGYSYNFHDVPPTFNLDPRVRVMIADYPKHRGVGKWGRLQSHLDLARAFQVLLPREPSGDYRILSIAFVFDPHPDGIPAHWSASPVAIADDIHTAYRAGNRSIGCEIDFNFGKFGLGYYLLTQMFWNAGLSARELDAVRDRWLRRAYGSAWKEMKAYHDFLLVENYPVNSAASWARAIRLLDTADRKLDRRQEPDAGRRIDDVKQYWYYHYLLQSGKAKKTDADYRTFLWKGQMSYMNAMVQVSQLGFGTQVLAQAVPAEVRNGPAHYSAEETQRWWRRVLDFWPERPAVAFADVTLANGRKGKSVDLNDLARIKEFEKLTEGGPYYYNSPYVKPPQIFTVARKGETIGWQLFWSDGSLNDPFRERQVPCRVEVWDRKASAWQPVAGPEEIHPRSTPMTRGPERAPWRHIEAKLTAPRDGTYRIQLVGQGGYSAYLTSLEYDARAMKPLRPCGWAYSGLSDGHTQAPTWFYIPRGTPSLDLDCWDGYGPKKLTLFRLQRGELVPLREIETGSRACSRIRLRAGEDGTLLRMTGNGLGIPYLYSLPGYWAKSPAELLLPREVAEADGWTVAP